MLPVFGMSENKKLLELLDNIVVAHMLENLGFHARRFLQLLGLICPANVQMPQMVGVVEACRLHFTLNVSQIQWEEFRKHPFSLAQMANNVFVLLSAV